MKGSFNEVLYSHELISASSGTNPGLHDPKLGVLIIQPPECFCIHSEITFTTTTVLVEE